MNSEQPRSAESDVVVLGLGAAGCAAAIEAHDAGARVVVLEKMPPEQAGGNTRVSGGGWFVSRDPEQAAQYLRSLCGPYEVPDKIVEAWAKETADNTPWMKSLAAEAGLFETLRGPEFPELAGSGGYMGSIHVKPDRGNGHLFDALSCAVRSRGIEVRFETRATELVQDPVSGGIMGVVAERHGVPMRLRAKRAVVVATGGFANEAQMARDYLGLSDVTPWGSPGSTGDGIKMAQKVGADLWHMNNYMPVVGLRAPGLGGALVTGFPHARGRFIYVALDGQRFANELPRMGHGKAFRYGRYEFFPSQPMHVVFDNQTRRAGPICVAVEFEPFGWNNLVKQYAWSSDNQAEIERGWVREAGSLRELAVALNMEPGALEATVREYNRMCSLGRDSRFGRDPATLAPLDKPPYYAFTWGSTIAFTCGGRRRNERAQVLNAFGQPIPRLYCAGEVSATYSFCFDAGMMIADALAFGRIAGREAAREPSGQ